VDGDADPADEPVMSDVHSVDRMRVVTWNMGMSPPRPQVPGLHDQAWHFLLGLGADLAFVQEARPPSWVRNEGSLVHGPFKRWASAIFSPRYPLQPVAVPAESPLPSLGSYLAVAVPTLPDGLDAIVSSVHAVARPAKPVHLGRLDARQLARSRGGPQLNDVVFAGLTNVVAERRFIAAGDWNTGRTQADLEAGARFFDRARQHGWTDCVWESRGEELQTWFRQGDVLVQNDHVFCDVQLGTRVLDTWVADDAARLLGLSDHGPLVVDFDVPPIAMTNIAQNP
jgi:hypothetical protein